LITFAYILPNVLPSRIIVVLSLGCNKTHTLTSNICCSMTWWSWLFMANNLFGPTCFLKATKYLIRTWIFDTKSKKRFIFFLCEHKGAGGLKKIVVPSLLQSHKCFCTLAFSISFRTSTMSLSPNKCFSKLSHTFCSTCITSNLLRVGSSYMHEPNHFSKSWQVGH